MDLTGLKHPALLKSSGWKYSNTLSEILAARWWGCPSIEYYRMLPREEKIQILAAYQIDWKMQAINNYEMQQKAIRDAKHAK